MSKGVSYLKMNSLINKINHGHMCTNHLQVTTLDVSVHVELTQHELLNLLHTVAARMRSEERVRALHKLEGNNPT